MKQEESRVVLRDLSCFISQTPRSLLQATVFTWIQDSGFKSFPLFILQNLTMCRRLWHITYGPHSTALMFRLHLVVLMIFTEKLQDAMNAHTPTPRHINETHCCIVMSGRLCCCSKTNSTCGSSAC